MIRVSTKIYKNNGMISSVICSKEDWCLILGEFEMQARASIKLHNTIFRAVWNLIYFYAMCFQVFNQHYVHRLCKTAWRLTHRIEAVHKLLSFVFWGKSFIVRQAAAWACLHWLRGGGSVCDPLRMFSLNKRSSFTWKQNFSQITGNSVMINNDYVFTGPFSNSVHDSVIEEIKGAYKTANIIVQPV